MTTTRTIQTTPATPRIRARRLFPEPSAPAVQPVAAVSETAPITDAMRALARAYYVANKQKNAFSREADRARATLFKQMATAGITDFRTVVDCDGAMLPIEAKIDTPSKDVISVEKLRTLVDDETFMKIVSATKTDVTKYAGTNVAMAATQTVPGKTDLRVTEIKEPVQ